MGKKRIWAIAVLGCTLCGDMAAQTFPSIGRPLQHSSFKAELAQAHPQNWSVLQGGDGRIYVGNGSGILVFDGREWTLVQTTNKSVVRSLAAGPDGVYVGASGDFGIVAPDNVGNLVYTSLAPLLQQADREFDDVWHTVIVDEAVYFVTENAIFRYSAGKIESLRSETGFHTAFVIQGRLVVREREVGLVSVEGLHRELVPFGSFFKRKRVYAMIERPGDLSPIVATRESGLWILHGDRKPERFVSEADEYLALHGVYKGIRIDNSRMAFATLGGGVVVVGIGGRLLDILGPDQGVEVVNYLFRDSDNALWVALDSGELVRVLLDAALSVLDSSNGLDGIVYHLARAGDRVYISSGSGLYAAGRNGDGAMVDRVSGIRLPKGIAAVGDSVVVAAEGQVHVVYDAKVVAAIEIANPHAVSVISNRRFLVGSSDGLSVIDFSQDAPSVRVIPDPVGDVRDVRRELDGSFLAVNRTSELYRVTVDGTTASVSEIGYRGLKPEGRVQFAKTRSPLLLVDAEVYRVVTTDAGRQEIVHYSELNETLEIADGDRIVALGDDLEGNTWVSTQRRAIRLEIDSTGSFDLVHIDSTLSFPKASVGAILAEANSLWLSSGKTLYHYDRSRREAIASVFPPLVTNVSSIGDHETIFGGHKSPTVASPRLAYTNNDIQFKYSAPIYYGQDHVEYQYRLDGRDADWTDWTKATIAEYTNLREGDYTFRVKAKNIYGFSSPEGTFSLSVLPPWYRTWWAYLFYVAGCATVAAFSMRYYRMTVAHRRAKEQEKELAAERIFSEKLRHANDKLKTANNRLIEVNALKDEFLATTSHELRTPITAIQGYAAILREELVQPHREFAEIIDKSSQRLMRTLNSVLDLAKLRSGAIDLHPSIVELNAFVRQTVESSDEAARSKNLTVALDLPQAAIHVECDQYLLRNSILNILDNAVKFSDAGTITVRVCPVEAGAEISVSDQGVGIDEDFLPLIFDEFKQESDGLAREHGGTGLGLAITALMIKELGGVVDVVSKKGEGTTVRITIPLAEHYGVAANPAPGRADDRSPNNRAEPTDKSARRSFPA